MTDLEIHLLDVGAIEYGDSVLCLAAGKTILIDGGKKASSRPTTGRVDRKTIHHVPIQDQIEAILDTTEVDLLVITHCHSDHVGNLPQLVRNGDIKCRFALLADPQFGFGITGDAAEPGTPDEMSPAEKLWMAMREEPVHSDDDATIRQFIEDSAAEYSEYVGLVNFLRGKLGERCVLYRGPSEAESAGLADLLGAFQDTGFKLFGPTKTQLGNCALFLAGRNEDVAELETELDKGGRVDLVTAYRNALRATAADVGDDGEVEGAEDVSENGNAVNNQSMVISIGKGKQRALLTADMQFVKPQLANDKVVEEMKKLRDAISADVEANGPFGFVKLSHHGATNGQDEALLKKWGNQLFGISTGSASTKHPTAPTLTALKNLKAAAAGIKWARTDMNGRVTYEAEGNTLKLTKDRGRISDLTAPAARAGDAGPEEEEVEVVGPQAGGGAAVQPQVRVETGTASGNVEVLVRLPYAKTRVTVTVEVEPGGLAGGPDSPR